MCSKPVSKGAWDLSLAPVPTGKQTFLTTLSAALKRQLHTSCVCCVPSCAHGEAGRLLTGAAQSNARGWCFDWDDLVQLPRSIPYNCVVYWGTYSQRLHQSISVFNQKIIQEERKLWSPCGPISCSKQTHFLDLEHQNFSIQLLKLSEDGEITWKNLFQWLSTHFEYFCPGRYESHLTDKHPTDSSGCPSAGNIFLQVMAWIL